jgi:tetratricopeptide (TPR) repeat protein
MECGVSHEALPLIEQAEAIYKLFDPSTIIEELGKLYRSRVGVASHERDPLALLQYALLGLELEKKRHEEIGHPTPILAVAYNDLAMGYALNREWDKAIPQLKRSREIREGFADFTKDKLFSPLYHLGLVLHHQGKDEEAERVLEQAIKDREEALGPENSINLRYG